MTPLSSPACSKDSKGGVTIGSNGCSRVYVDKSFTGVNGFSNIRLAHGAALCIRDSDVNGGALALNAAAITVQGVFAVGSKDNPIGKGNAASQVTITFIGAKPAQAPPDNGCASPNFFKGLQVCKGGSLRLFGAKGAPPAGSRRSDGTRTSWTFLRQLAGDPARFSAVNLVSSPVTAADAQFIRFPGCARCGEKPAPEDWLWQRHEHVAVGRRSWAAPT